MKIECNKVQNEITYTTTCKPVKFCCKKMKQVFDKKHKKHYSDGSGDFDMLWILDKCGIEIPTRTSGSCSNYPEAYVRIDYCPFCGEEIE